MRVKANELSPMSSVPPPPTTPQRVPASELQPSPVAQNAAPSPPVPQEHPVILRDRYRMQQEKAAGELSGQAVERGALDLKKAKAQQEAIERAADLRKKIEDAYAKGDNQAVSRLTEQLRSELGLAYGHSFDRSYMYGAGGLRQGVAMTNRITRVTGKMANFNELSPEEQSMVIKDMRSEDQQAVTKRGLSIRQLETSIGLLKGLTAAQRWVNLQKTDIDKRWAANAAELRMYLTPQGELLSGLDDDKRAKAESLREQRDQINREYETLRDRANEMARTGGTHIPQVSTSDDVGEYLKSKGIE